MFKCEKCGSELETNAKFCINCGKEMSSDIKVTESKDLSWYFLIVAFLLGLPGGIKSVKNSYGSTADLSIFEFMNGVFKLERIPIELYGEIIGASVSPLIIASVIIGFIWGIKSIFSKKYEKPIKSIFIGSLVFSIPRIFAY